MGLRKAGLWLGLVEHEDDELIYEDHFPGDAYVDEDQPADSEVPDVPSSAGGMPAGGLAAGGMPAGRGVQLATVRPQTFRDAHTIGEYFRQDIPVIINLQDMDGSDAKRIVDFASGLIFGRQGDIERLSSRVFIILPPHSSLLRDPGTLADKGFFNQA